VTTLIDLVFDNIVEIKNPENIKQNSLEALAAIVVGLDPK